MWRKISLNNPSIEPNWLLDGANVDDKQFLKIERVETGLYITQE